ncbi:hypothetical protein HU200_007982 [Digitaria exilis]|uniref:Uncharacterized protein n=1 Tax=Digitaria exilis TaxID=1010633 RepID=A0A835KS15_9POAL|nr:hypothetical protein HU200_007982 [Digitaria exilis]
MAVKALLVVILVQVLGVLAVVAARPLQEGAAGARGDGGWMAGSIGMITQMLLGSKSGSNPKSHCC